jgi:hypothetical protein
LAATTADKAKIYYQCLPCQQYYDCRGAIQQHFSESHDNNLVLSKDNEVKIRHTVKCLICQKSDNNVIFDNIQEAMLHRHNAHFYTIDHSPDHPVTRFIVKPDQKEIRVIGKMLYYPKDCFVEEFQCVCDKVYNFKSLAVKCMSKHIGIRRFKCDRQNNLKIGIFFFNNELRK